MDAIKFLDTYRRICNEYDDCSGCPLQVEDLECMLNGDASTKDDVVVSVVEKWEREHPIKTRQSEFLKLFPGANISNGILALSPCMLEADYRSDKCHDCCNECKRKYWSEEVT